MLFLKVFILNHIVPKHIQNQEDLCLARSSLKNLEVNDSKITELQMEKDSQIPAQSSSDYDKCEK